MRATAHFSAQRSTSDTIATVAIHVVPSHRCDSYSPMHRRLCAELGSLRVPRDSDEGVSYIISRSLDHLTMVTNLTQPGLHPAVAILSIEAAPTGHGQKTAAIQRMGAVFCTSDTWSLCSYRISRHGMAYLHC